MEFTIIDFFIGFTLMNAMPHLIFAQTKTRMLSLFGFTIKANYLYSFFNLLIALILFTYKYSFKIIFLHGIFLGALIVLIIYIFLGKFFLRFFKNKYEN